MKIQKHRTRFYGLLCGLLLCSAPVPMAQASLEISGEAHPAGVVIETEEPVHWQIESSSQFLRLTKKQKKLKKAGAKVYRQTCMLGGCHALDAKTRFSGLTTEEFNSALASQPLMAGVSVSAKQLKALIYYLSTLPAQ